MSLLSRLARRLIGSADEQRLVVFVQGGSEVAAREAFAALYERLNVSLLRVTRLRVHNDDDAKAGVEEAFVELWLQRRAGRWQGLPGLMGWLTRVAHGRGVDAFRRRTRHQLTGDPPPEAATGNDLDPAWIAAAGADCRRAVELINALPPNQRQALVAVALEGRPAEEVAEQLGCAVATVRQWVFQARNRLAAEMGAEFAAEYRPARPTTQPCEDRTS